MEIESIESFSDGEIWLEKFFFCRKLLEFYNKRDGAETRKELNL